jgi:site-specific DNA-methyltransferase (adenine-specific)
VCETLGVDGMKEPVIIGNATLYNCDSRDLIEKIEADVFISDPPYGIGFNYGGDYLDKGGDEYLHLIGIFKNKRSVLLQYPEETMRYLVPVLGVPDDCVAWCYNSNTNRQFRLWSFFGIKPNFDAYKVKAKNPNDKRVSEYVRSYDWFDDIQQVKNVSSEKTDHPCQVSEEMMKRIILLSGGSFICDPFLGSGSTGVACANLGISFIGIERDEKYFDIACERISRAVNQERLFA